MPPIIRNYPFREKMQDIPADAHLPDESLPIWVSVALWSPGNLPELDQTKRNPPDPRKFPPFPVLLDSACNFPFLMSENVFDRWVRPHVHFDLDSIPALALPEKQRTKYKRIPVVLWVYENRRSTTRRADKPPHFVWPRQGIYIARHPPAADKQQERGDQAEIAHLHRSQFPIPLLGVPLMRAAEWTVTIDGPKGTFSVKSR